MLKEIEDLRPSFVNCIYCVIFQNIHYRITCVKQKLTFGVLFLHFCNVELKPSIFFIRSYHNMDLLAFGNAVVRKSILNAQFIVQEIFKNLNVFLAIEMLTHDLLRRYTISTLVTILANNDYLCRERSMFFP